MSEMSETNASSREPAREPAADRRAPRTANRLRRAALGLLARLHQWAESGWAGSATATCGVLRARWFRAPRTPCSCRTKAMCLGAGAFGVPFAPFIAALGAGRIVRFAVVGLVLRLAGDRMDAILRRRLGRGIERLG